MLSFAHTTSRTNRRDSRLRADFESVRVDDSSSVSQLAAESERERLARLAVSHGPPLHRAGDPEIVTAVGHFGDLRDDLSGVGERLVDIPQWACAAARREVKSCGGLAFRHVSRAVDADE